jgi:hypothetical protein
VPQLFQLGNRHARYRTAAFGLYQRRIASPGPRKGQ